MLRLGAKLSEIWGVLSLILGTFRKALSLGAKLSHVMRKVRLTDIGESEL